MLQDDKTIFSPPSELEGKDRLLEFLQSEQNVLRSLICIYSDTLTYSQFQLLTRYLGETTKQIKELNRLK